MVNFVLAMLNNPDVMRKAQAELDAVMGRDRVPTFEDADSLPYIRAVVRETLRWRPPSTLGTPIFVYYQHINITCLQGLTITDVHRLD